MDVVESRFFSFKILIRSSLPESHRNNPMVIMLEQSNLALFLQTIKSKKDQNYKEVMSELLEKMNLTLQNIDTNHIDKLLKYIEYFIEVASL